MTLRVACLAVLGVALSVSAHTVQAKTKNAPFVALGHSSNGGDNQLAVAVSVRTGAPGSICVGGLALHGRRMSLPRLRTGRKSGAKWEWEIAPGSRAGVLKVTVHCRVNRRLRHATTRFEVREGRPSRRGFRRIVAIGTMRTRKWEPHDSGDGTGGGSSNLYPRGQCTWFVAALRGDLPYFANANGDARNWGRSAANAGWQVDQVPAVGAVAVFQPNQYGAGYMGHVAYVTEVHGTQIKVAESNFAGRGVKGTRLIPSAGLEFIHGRRSESSAVPVPSSPATPPAPSNSCTTNTTVNNNNQQNGQSNNNGSNTTITGGGCNEPPR